jgi:CRP-like cAMP-binding protein
VTVLLNVPGKNRLLEAIGEHGRELASRAERVEAQRGHVLYNRSDAIAYVHFPLEGMVSLVLGAESGMSVEIGTVGNEGLVGTPAYLKSERSHADTFFQTSGSYLRLPVREFNEALAENSQFDRLVARYTQSIINQMAQSVMCGALHTVEERLSRWLLMTHDRRGTDELDLTQEFIAQMLGVRRPSVTVVAGALQRAGLIRYNRGSVTVLDRKGLEESACECYRLVRAEMERLVDA